MITNIDLTSIINKISQTKRSLIITLPEKTRWEDFAEELKKVENYKKIINFKVHNFPNGITKGDKCYLVHNDYIIGWMEIVGFREKTYYNHSIKKRCQGKFIERSGPFHYMSERIPYKGFQGFRYFNLEDYKLKHNISN